MGLLPWQLNNPEDPIMKKKRIIVITSLAAMAALVFSCITFKTVSFPTNAKAGEDFNIKVNFEFEGGTERSGNLIVAFPVPKSWKASETVTGTLTTHNLPGGQPGMGLDDITDEPLTLAADVIEPTTVLPYPSAMLSQYGVLGNTGPVEWIVLKSQTVFNVHGNAPGIVTADIDIHLKAGNTNVKFFSAVVICLSGNGFNTANAGEFEISETQTVQVTGGTGSDDFTVVHFVSTTPQTFRFGDYVSVEFVSEADGVQTDLYGLDEVYLNATATLADGSIKTADKVLMIKRSEVSYFKYIYPKTFFGLGEDAEISEMHVWFTNADGSVTVTDGTEGFLLSQAAEE